MLIMFIPSDSTEGIDDSAKCQPDIQDGCTGWDSGLILRYSAPSRTECENQLTQFSTV